MGPSRLWLEDFPIGRLPQPIQDKKSERVPQEITFG